MVMVRDKSGLAVTSRQAPLDLVEVFSWNALEGCRCGSPSSRTLTPTPTRASLLCRAQSRKPLALRLSISEEGQVAATAYLLDTAQGTVAPYDCEIADDAHAAALFLEDKVLCSFPAIGDLSRPGCTRFAASISPPTATPCRVLVASPSGYAREVTETSPLDSAIKGLPDSTEAQATPHRICFVGADDADDASASRTDPSWGHSSETRRSGIHAETRRAAPGASLASAHVHGHVLFYSKPSASPSDVVRDAAAAARRASTLCSSALASATAPVSASTPVSLHLLSFPVPSAPHPVSVAFASFSPATSPSPSRTPLSPSSSLASLDDASLSLQRAAVHTALHLPTSPPIFLLGMSFPARALSLAALHRSGALLGPELVSRMPLRLRGEGSMVEGGRRAMVRGAWEFRHYGQEGEDDGGWGCAYRSLQTVSSWLIHQGYSWGHVPSVRDVQVCPVAWGLWHT